MRNGNGGLLGGADVSPDVTGGDVLASCFRACRFGFFSIALFFLAVSVIFAQLTMMQSQLMNKILAP